MALPEDRSGYDGKLIDTWDWTGLNPTPVGTNPFVRIMTPIGQIDGNATIPQAQNPQKRAGGS